MEQERQRFPKIKKILHTNLVNISSLADKSYFKGLRSFSKGKELIVKIAQQSPKSNQIVKGTTLKYIKKTSKDNILKQPMDFDSSRKNESRYLKVPFYRYYDELPDERSATVSLSIKRGLSGCTISKLHKSRLEIKNRSRFN